MIRYCPRSRLPLLHVTKETSVRNIWSDAFAYTSADAQAFSLYNNVLDCSNKKLSVSQKETLFWYHRLSHASLSWIQLLMRDRKWLRDHVSEHALHQGPFIPCKEPRGAVCDISGMKCAACLAAKARFRSPTAERPAFRSPTQLKLDKFKAKIEGRREKKLKRNHTLPGDCISADHYISAVPGRLPHSFGRERQGYTCGTLFVDHASGKVFNFCQFPNCAAETIQNKHRLETLARNEGIYIKEYHSDNDTFASAAFKDDCGRQEQQQSFSGVGAQHQNGVAERNIQTVAQWARTSLVHAAYHCPAKSSVRLWPMAIAYAVWVFNCLPQIDTGLCPNEIWSQIRFAHEDFRRAHVFGCPVYVLEPKLQDGKKIPKWDPRARLGIFVGFSALHSSLVPLVLNVRTGKISPQYHVIFDDKFETVTSLPPGDSIGKQWDRLFKLERECYLDEEYDSDGLLKTNHLPDLDEEWLDPAWLPSTTPFASPNLPTGVSYPSPIPLVPTNPQTRPVPTPGTNATVVPRRDPVLIDLTDASTPAPSCVDLTSDDTSQDHPPPFLRSRGG